MPGPPQGTSTAAAYGFFAECSPLRDWRDAVKSLAGRAKQSSPRDWLGEPEAPLERARKLLAQSRPDNDQLAQAALDLLTCIQLRRLR